MQRLDRVDRALLSRTGSTVRTAVNRSGLPRVGGSAEEPRVSITAFCQSLPTFVWAVANGCPWQFVTTCRDLAEGGHLEVLRWAREHGCPWNSSTCQFAAWSGHVEVLRWAWEHDCPLGMGSACEDAAARGHLEVLKWLREQNCQWGTLICKYAAQRGHLEMLQWAREHGCPWQPHWCVQFADERGHVELAQWVRDQPDYDEDEHPSEEF